eukprot:3325122-Rhodomonas_salina.1
MLPRLNTACCYCMLLPYAATVCCYRMLLLYDLTGSAGAGLRRCVTYNVLPTLYAATLYAATVCCYCMLLLYASGSASGYCVLLLYAATDK